MENYIDNAHKANQNWRRAFYEKFVVEMGISEGALLNLKERSTYHNHSRDGLEKGYIGIVTDVNWHELSLFCSSTATSGRYCGRSNDYIQHLKVTVQLDKETKVISFGQNEGIDIAIDTVAKNLVKHSGGRNYWSAPEFVSVLSPSETPIGEAWIAEGHRKSLEFLTKKRSEDKLDEEQVTALIDRWS